MQVLPEYFDATQFRAPGYEQFFTIKRPYTTITKNMSLKFEDYQANLKVQCVIFDRIWTTCVNMYGYKVALRKHRCFEMLNYFDQCRKINEWFAKDKKYFPQRYATSKYYWVNPHHDYVHVEPSRNDMD